MRRGGRFNCVFFVVTFVVIAAVATVAAATVVALFRTAFIVPTAGGVIV